MQIVPRFATFIYFNCVSGEVRIQATRMMEQANDGTNVITKFVYWSMFIMFCVILQFVLLVDIWKGVAALAPAI